MERGIYSIYFLIKKLMEEKLIHPEMNILYVYPSEKDDSYPFYAGVNGFIKTITKENPHLCFKSLEIEASNFYKEDYYMNNIIQEFGDISSNIEIKYEQTDRHVKHLDSVYLEEVENLTYNGLYVITGGLGGIGYRFAQYLLSKSKCKVLLIGRSELIGDKVSLFEKLKKINRNVTYSKADVSNYSEIKRVLEEARQRFGEIKGILHCAGVIKDNFLIKKDKSEFDEVLKPKVTGTLHLDKLTASDHLQFFALFSSITATLGNIGQADYAYANSFMDGFSIIREDKREKGYRSGKSLSINWPLWEDGGMKILNRYKESEMEEQAVEHLTSKEGIDAFEKILTSPYSSVTVLMGEDVTTIKNTLNKKHSKESVFQQEKLENEKSIQKHVEKYLMSIIAQETQLSYQKLKSGKTFDEYGLNSLMILNMTEEMEKVFVSLPKTLFFEYRNIEELSQYLIMNYDDAIQKVFSNTNTEVSKVDDEDEKRYVTTEVKKIDSDLPLVSSERDIAIIGLSGKYPMAENLKELWTNLKNGADCITEIPRDRWDYKKYFDSDKNKKGKVYTKWGGFINDIDKFDPLFFNIAPKEAELLDPQERLFLETAWSTIEDAGYTSNRLSKSKVGVYVGVMWGQYQLYGTNKQLLEKTNSNYASIANRVSYMLNFHGPSMAIDTMCSSSLTAIKLAYDALIKGEIDYALAGGVNIASHPNKYFLLSQGKFGSTDGRCRSFGEGGDGYVPGEGVGAVLLKPLSKAVKDGDNIYGVIKASALNHGGKTNGYTVPNPVLQADLITNAIKEAGINPRSISYMEAHGTGTALGDPIEIAGINKAFSNFTNEKQFCAIGSIKSNIGHLESAAGIAALTKVLLQMKHKLIVPSLHSNILNSRIDFKNSPVFVQKQLKDWENPVIKEGDKITTYPRRAGISSFGAGGSNAFLLIEEYDQYSREKDKTQLGKKKLIVLSAKNKERLKVYANELKVYLEDESSKRNTKEFTIREYTQLFQEDLLEMISSIVGETKQSLNVDDKISDYLINVNDVRSLLEKINDKYGTRVSLYDLTIEASIYNISKILLDEYYEQIKLFFYKKLNITNEKEKNNEDWFTLSNIAYTLQVGRTAMEERVAFISEDIEDLINALNCFIEDKASKVVFQRNIKQIEDMYNSHAHSDFTTNDNVELLISKNEYEEIAKLWVQGLDINWEYFYESGKYSILSLPTYPFIRDRYWIPSGLSEEKVSLKQYLHPLIDNNISTLNEQGFMKLFNADKEMYIRDHIINGRNIVPGAIFAEMARAAGELINNGKKVIKIKDLQWLNPVKFEDESKEIKIYFNSLVDEVEFKIMTDLKERKMYSKGTIVFGDMNLTNEKVDIDGVRSRCLNIINRKEVYKLFADRGLVYKSYMQPIQEILYNDSEVISKLCLPVEDSIDNHFILHPVLLDGALQSVLGLEKSYEEGIIRLPYQIREISINGVIPKECYVYVKKNQDDYTLSIIDTNGTVLVNIEGFLLKNQHINKDNDIKELYFQDIWEKRSLSSSTVEKLSGNILVFEDDYERFKNLKYYIEQKHDKCSVTQVRTGDIFEEKSEEFEINPKNQDDYTQLIQAVKNRNYESVCILYLWDYVQVENFQLTIPDVADKKFSRLLYLVQALIRIKLDGNVRFLNVYSGEKNNWLSASTNAFFKSARLEYPRVCYKTILFDNISNDFYNATSVICEELLHTMQDVDEVLITKEGRAVRQLRDCNIVETALSNVRKKSSVSSAYIITGGTGGLGLLFTKHLASKGNCTVIIIGRSELTIEKQSTLKKIKGVQVDYIKADISDLHEMKRVFHELKKKYKVINGVIHSAGVIKDSLIQNKEVFDIKEVLKPKISGIVNLDEITKDEPLEFFVVFSSIAAVMGSRGQSDYAFANRFMDMFIDHRNQLVENKERYGISQSINWPLWENGGMQMSHTVREKMKERTGLVSLKTETGLNIFDKLLETNLPRLMVVEGESRKIRQWIYNQAKISSTNQKNNIEENKITIQSKLFVRILEYLKELVSDVTKVPVSLIKEKQSLERYGVDSVLLMEIGNNLEQCVGSNAQSILLEYNNLYDLSEYLTKHYNKELMRFFNIDDFSVSEKNVDDSILKSVVHTEDSEEQKENSKDIAIIGLSGRYPKAKNIEEFWSNLVNGENCITEIPKERWDSSLFYNPDKEIYGKSFSKWGGFIEDVDKFDPLFFNISPREAELMDPQERIMLEVTWHALEDAGYSLKKLRQLQEEGQQVGVFIGSMYQQYPWTAANREIGATLSGNSYWAIPNRISYFLGVEGPSLAIDTACSSSFSALHLAISSLQKGECSIAIVGGVNLSLHPYKYIGLSQKNLLGSKERSLSLGLGDGYVPGEGAGVVILKSLTAAQQDEDKIYCKIKSSAMKHAGNSNAFTAPSKKVQKDLVLKAFEESNVDPLTIGYYEVAANGSAKGDAIEIEALKEAYKEFTELQNICAIGSVKSNIGHLEASSAMSQLTKVILQLKQETLVPSINSEILNPEIDLKNSPFFVQQTTGKWKRKTMQHSRGMQELPLRAAINSIGAGGTGVTVVLEEYISQNKKQRKDFQKQPILILLSARNEEQLYQVTLDLKEHLENNPDMSLHACAYSLSLREPMEERLAFVVNDKNEFLDVLQRYIKGEQNTSELYRGSIEEQKGVPFELNSRDNNISIQDLGRYWVKGYDFEWEEYFNKEYNSKVSLPSYPFKKESYWIETNRGFDTVNKVQENDLSNNLIVELKEILSQLLYIPMERIKENRSFDKFGMDSLVALKMINSLEERYGVKIPIEVLFKNYSLTKLSDYITKNGFYKVGKLKTNNADKFFDSVNYNMENSSFHLDNLILSSLEEGKIEPEEAVILKERIISFIERSEVNDRERNLPKTL
ncbi:DszB [Bacillus wiedmannii]|nr:DszB [Bacillus wiedmannii]